MICDYGCGKEAKYQFKNGKWCCSKHSSQCMFIKVSKKTKWSLDPWMNSLKLMC